MGANTKQTNMRETSPKQQQIVQIIGHEPNREGEYPFFYKVGLFGVTKIINTERYYGDHGIGQFDVYKGDDLFATVTHKAIAEIRYVNPSVS